MMDLRRNIIGVAWDLFVRDGFAGVTVTDIAAAGGFSKRTIYDRFKNKEALFAATVESYVTSGIEAFSSPNAGAPLRDVLSTIAKQIVTIAASDEVQLIECLPGLEDGKFPGVVKVLRSGHEMSAIALRTIIQRVISDRSIDEVDLDRAVRCWLDMIVGHARNFRRREAGNARLQSHLDQWLDILVEMGLRLMRF